MTFDNGSTFPNPDSTPSGPQGRFYGFQSTNHALDRVCKLMHASRNLAELFGPPKPQAIFLEELKTIFDYRDACQTFHDLAFEFHSIVAANPPLMNPLRTPLVRSIKLAYLFEDVFSRRVRSYDLQSLSIELNTVSYRIWGGVEDVDRLLQATGPRALIDSLDWDGNPTQKVDTVLPDSNNNNDSELLDVAFPELESEVDSNPPEPLETEPMLTSRAQLVLIAMLELDAVDSDRRKPTETIATKAISSMADANAIKAVINELRTLGMLETKIGSGGGCWLTRLGLARAEKLQRLL